MNAPDYPDTMTATQVQRDARMTGRWFGASVGVVFAVVMASRYVMNAGVPPLVVLAVALAGFVVAGVVGTRRELRRREAAREAVMAAGR